MSSSLLHRSTEGEEVRRDPGGRAHTIASRVRLVVVAVTLVTVAVYPLAADNEYYQSMIGRGLIWAMLAASLGLLIGQSGLVSFGHAGWFGLGAYVGGLSLIHISSDLLVAAVVVLVVAALVALVFGVVMTRLAGVSFAIMTLALGQILYTAVFLFARQTGGEDGLTGVPMVTAFGHEIDPVDGLYYVILAIVLLTVAGFAWLTATPLGGTWRALRENEQRARFLGVNVGRGKLVLFVLTSTVAALSGLLYVAYNGAASPDLIHWSQSGEVMMSAIAGGTSSLFGPAVGGFVVYVLHQQVSSSSADWQVILGLVFMAVVIFLPQGLAGIGRRGRQ